MDEQALDEIKDRMKDKKKFVEEKKNRVYKYIENVMNFVKEEATVLNLKDGYNIIERATFEMEFVPKIIPFEKPNGEKFDLNFIYSGNIDQAIGSPFRDAMEMDDFGIKGSSKPEQLSGFKFECPNEECQKQIQLIQHEVFAIRDKENNILISIKPSVECPHCNSQIHIERSKVKPRRY